MKRLIQSALVIFLLFSSCKKDKLFDKIDSVIRMKMGETFYPANRTFQFSCSTEKIYECCNYTINKDFDISNNKIDIDFISIINPEICLTATGPATTTVDLGTLSNGTYELKISIGDEKSTGHLIVSTDSYVITLDQQKQIQIVNNTLNRVPANTIWGTVGYDTISTTNLVQTFIDSLQLLGATTPTYATGDYGYFQIDGNGQIVAPTNSGYNFIRPYIYNYSNNSSTIKTLVKNYGMNHNDSLKISLYTTQGEIFNSWVQ